MRVVLLRHDRTKHRTWVCNLRIHHGLLGLGFFLAASPFYKSPAGHAFLAAGAALMWHDRRDAPWLTDNP